MAWDVPRGTVVRPFEPGWGDSRTLPQRVRRVQPPSKGRANTSGESKPVETEDAYDEQPASEPYRYVTRNELMAARGITCKRSTLPAFEPSVPSAKQPGSAAAPLGAATDRGPARQRTDLMQAAMPNEVESVRSTEPSTVQEEEPPSSGDWNATNFFFFRGSTTAPAVEASRNEAVPPAGAPVAAEKERTDPPPASTPAKNAAPPPATAKPRAPPSLNPLNAPAVSLNPLNAPAAAVARIAPAVPAPKARSQAVLDSSTPHQPQRGSKPDANSLNTSAFLDEDDSTPLLAPCAVNSAGKPFAAVGRSVTALGRLGKGRKLNASARAATAVPAPPSAPALSAAAADMKTSASRMTCCCVAEVLVMTLQVLLLACVAIFIGVAYMTVSKTGALAALKDGSSANAWSALRDNAPSVLAEIYKDESQLALSAYQGTASSLERMSNAAMDQAPEVIARSRAVASNVVRTVNENVEAFISSSEAALTRTKETVAPLAGELGDMVERGADLSSAGLADAAHTFVHASHEAETAVASVTEQARHAYLTL